MLSWPYPVTVGIAVLAVLFGSSARIYATDSSFEQGSLPTGQITVDPPFATVGEHSDLLVTVKLTEPDLEVPVRPDCGPTGNLLPVNIVAAAPGKAYAETVEFDVPKGGAAVLRLVNGARIGAAEGERVAQAQIALNGEPVATVAETTHVTEAPVALKPGRNRLKVDNVKGKSGQRLSVRIDACPDTIALAPVRNAVVARTETVPAKARVTALGLPVTSAAVKFAIAGLGDVPAASASTDRTGKAQAALGPIAATGAGNLKATLAGADPPLAAATGIEVLTQAPLTVRQRPPTLRLETGASRVVSVAIDVREVAGSDNRVTLRHLIEPESGGDPEGVTVTSDFAGKALDAPESFPVLITVSGETPGSYRILSTATNEKTSTSATDELTVRVVTPETLILSQPTLEPGGIPIKIKAPVIIQSQASGGNALPATLDVQECAPATSACDTDTDWRTVGTLRDDGQAPDTIAGNGVYSGKLDLFGGAEGQLLYRVTASHGRERVFSGATVLQVTRFVVGASRTPMESVDDPASDARFAAEQVLVSFLPATTPERIEAIIAAALGAVTDQKGQVIGYLPEISLYQVAWSVDDTLSLTERAAQVHTAVDAFNRFEAVRYATPNGIGEFTSEPDGSGVDSGRGRWGALRIRAGDAWDAAGISDFSTVAFEVAALEEGVFANHSELGTIDPSADTDPRSDSHGTSVAGVIAASLDSSTSGMSGIAPGVPIKRVATECNGGQLDDAVLTAKNDLDVKIINITCAMIPSNTSNPFPDLDSALQQAATRPAPAGGPTLVVASAGNYGDDVDSPTIPYYPCKFNNVFCVGNTTLANPTNLSSADNLHDASQTWGQNHDGTAHDCGSNLSSIPGFTYGASNYGLSVDIYAPGTCIYTTERGGGYHWVTGTSFAAPHVSGGAAVVWEKLQQLGAAPTALQVQNYLIDNAVTFDVTRKRLNLFSAIEDVVTDYNHNPVITSPGSTNVAENTTAVMTVTATDVDLPPQTLSFGKSGGADQARFIIDALSGALSFSASPDFEAPVDANADNVYEVVIQVADNYGGTAIQAISVTVTDVGLTIVATDTRSGFNPGSGFQLDDATNPNASQTVGGATGTVDRRVAFEFGLSTIPSGATIQSASLKLVANAASTSLSTGSTAVSTFVHGYSGNGVVEVADLTVSNSLGGAFPSTFTDGTFVLAPIVLDITTFLQNRVAANDSFAGVMLLSNPLPTAFMVVGYSANDLSLLPEASRPRLEVELSN